MSERAALISAILDNPDDDTPRLVFADWLQEHADNLPAKERQSLVARAEFIRLQCELARLPFTDRARSKLMKRVDALLKKWAAKWQAALGCPNPVYSFWGFQRGFYTDIKLWPCDFAANAAAWFALEPVGITLWLVFNDASGSRASLEWVDALAANPHLKAVRTLESNLDWWNAECFSHFMQSPHLVNLERIDLSCHEITGESIETVIKAPAPFQLKSLELVSGSQYMEVPETKATVDIIKLVANAPRFASLKKLRIWSNSFGNKCVKALLASKTLPGLLQLSVEDNDFDRQLLVKLAKRFIISSDEDED
jgi:uncharacterized protein (TIGR02996 family)